MFIPTTISVVDMVWIVSLSVLSVLIFIYFIFNKIRDEKLGILFLNQRFVNLILALFGLFYLINWFDKFCINYRIWVSIYSFIALPCCLALPFVYLLFRKIQKGLRIKKENVFQTIRSFIFDLWKSFEYIAFEILFTILILAYYSTLTIFYPYTNIGCGLGLVSNAHYSTILFLILIFFASVLSFYKPLKTKKKIISKTIPLILLRLIVISMSLVGWKYFVAYQQGNCISVARETWILINAISWIPAMALAGALFTYLVDFVIRYLRTRKSKEL